MDLDFEDQHRRKEPLYTDPRLSWVEYIWNDPECVRCKICKSKMKVKKSNLLVHASTGYHKQAARILRAQEMAKVLHAEQVQKIQLPTKRPLLPSMKRARDLDEIEHLKKRKLQMEAQLDAVLQYKRQLETLNMELNNDLMPSEHTMPIVNEIE